MIARLQQHVVPITIGVSFYVFGFFVTVNALGLTEQDIVMGLLCGAIGGMTTLATVLRAENGRRFLRRRALAPGLQRMRADRVGRAYWAVEACSPSIPQLAVHAPREQIRGMRDSSVVFFMGCLRSQTSGSDDNLHRQAEIHCRPRRHGARLALRARAQQAAMPVIGFVNSTAPDQSLRRASAFRQGLGEMGFVERRNVMIEYRWAENQVDRLPRLAADLVHRPVDVIATTGGTVSARAAKQATSTIPVVFEIGGDPIAAGLVDNLGRPGGNVTGISLNAVALAPKQLELLRELNPKATKIGVLINPDNPNSVTQGRVEAAARAIGLQTLFLNVTNETGFDAPFTALVQQHADALLVGNDPFLINWRDKIVALAAHHRVPTIFAFGDYAAAGGLISYGASIPDAYRHVGVYTGRILKGEKPADLPVIVSTKFELVINITTARTLRLDVPPALLARADRVIE